MFETSVVKARTVAAQKHYGVLAVSLGLHSAAALALVVVSVANVSFPKDAPRMISFFNPIMPVSLPLPKGNPDAPRNPAAQPPEQQRSAATPPAVTAPPAIVTPTVIPSTITPVDSAGPGDVNVGPSTPGTGERWGDPEGDPNVVDIGQTGINPTPAVPDVVYAVGAGVKSAVVLHRVQPEYPRVAIGLRLDGHVIIHCIIDRNGQMRDATIVRSSNAIFNQSALQALSQWRFAPGSMNGQAVDTYFDLTIHFAVKR